MSKREPIVHELKSWPDSFEAVALGAKTAEFRLNDRDFRVGDKVKLRYWDPATETYSGRFICGRISHVAYGPSWGIPDGWCMFSMKGLIDQTGKGIY